MERRRCEAMRAAAVEQEKPSRCGSCGVPLNGKYPSIPSRPQKCCGCKGAPYKVTSERVRRSDAHSSCGGPEVVRKSTACGSCGASCSKPNEQLLIKGSPAQPQPEQDQTRPCGSNFVSKPISSGEQILHEETNLEVLLLADTTLQLAPLHVRQLFKHYSGSHITQAHTLFLLIYILALETGFISENVYSKYHRVVPKVLPNCTFHSKFVLFCCRHKPLYNYDSNNELYFTINLRVYYKGLDDMRLKSTLIATVSGEFLIVTLQPVPITNLPGCSTSLSITRYVISQINGKKPISHYFRKLDELSAQMRDDVLTPIRNAQLSLLKASPVPSLIGLPSSVREQIYSKLRDADLDALALTNKFLQNEINGSERGKVNDEEEMPQIPSEILDDSQMSY